MNKKEILKEESNKMRKLMGLEPINEDMLDDIINKIKDSEIVKKIEDFFDGEDGEESEDKSVEDFFKSVEKDPSKTDDMISPLCGSEYEWKVTSEFGDRTRGGESEKHPANDLKAKQGTKLVSPFNGEVIESATVNTEKFLKTVNLISERFKFKGPVCFQFIEDSNNQLWIIEINARMGGGCTLSIGSGFDIPDLLISVFCKNNFSINDYKSLWKPNYYLKRYYSDYYYEKICI
jgi:hypothetical protein